MSNRKEEEREDFWNRKTTKFLFSIFAGLTQRFSIRLLLNARKQINELIGQIKRGILAIFFLVSGLFFLLIGAAVYIENSWNFVSGGGYLMVGGLTILTAFLIVFTRK